MPSKSNYGSFAISVLIACSCQGAATTSNESGAVDALSTADFFAPLTGLSPEQQTAVYAVVDKMSAQQQFALLYNAASDKPMLIDGTLVPSSKQVLAQIKATYFKTSASLALATSTVHLPISSPDCDPDHAHFDEWESIGKMTIAASLTTAMNHPLTGVIVPIQPNPDVDGPANYAVRKDAAGVASLMYLDRYGSGNKYKKVDGWEGHLTNCFGPVTVPAPNAPNNEPLVKTTWRFSND